jgi:cell division protein FtsQ
MIDVDPNDAARAIEALPWVAEARVVRHWPSTVEVTLLERSAVAVVPAGENGWVLVDSTGRILSEERDPPAELVKLHAEVSPGPPGSVVDPASRGALGVFDALPAALNGRVTAMATAGDAVTLTIDGRVAVSFGPPSGVHEKLIALETLLTRVDIKAVKTIDVRVPTAPVITH